ncbi:MAG TPA: lytic transglycosylase F [Pyrinomonadaceae bacterium]|nr:lytic transglycosylase F [Pyrinomonadaceae bacterium]
MLKEVTLAKNISAALLALVLLWLPACTKPAQQPASSAQQNAPEQPKPQAPESAQNIDPSITDRLKNERWTGDIDGLRERRYIRALVLYNKTNFFYDGPQPRGVTYEALKEFEKFLNTKLKTGDKPVHLVFIPVARDEMLQRMRDGRGDIAASNIPILAELQQFVDFSEPVRDAVKEVIVTGPSAPPVASLEDLAGKEVFVRKVSRYWLNLERLNQRFRAEGRPAVVLKEADANLEDEDILDMVNAGLVGVTVMDDLVANFWAKVYDGIRVHNDLSIADEDKIGWAVQKGAPQFLSLINEFVKDHKIGTSFGNTMLQKYLRDTKWAKNSVAPQEMEKFRTAIAFFKKYSTQYNFEWLMIAAQAYQESTIDQSKTSPVGAVGVMQIKPSTAADKSVNIQGVDKDMEKNINAGVKYLNFIMENYFNDARMNSTNRGLFAFASYNAGPNRIARLRKQAEAEGLDPNIWFDNVELIAAKDIGAETVTYVSNIYKYYVAYQMTAETTKNRRSKQS